MPYLIHCETHECVDISVIIGVATDKNGVFELLHNLSTLKIKSIENYNLENDNDDISIYLITDDDYNYFQQYYKQKRHKLECNRMKYYEYDYDVVQEIKEYFWHLVIELDGKKDKLFNKEFINKYNSIIEQKSIL